MTGRSDVYVGFVERSLQLLRPDGKLGFICVDRWMRNQYGADLREYVTRSCVVETVIPLHEADVFETSVLAYPSIFVLRAAGGPLAADAPQAESDRQHARTNDTVKRSPPALRKSGGREVSSGGRDFWASGTPAHLEMITDLERRFPLLEGSARRTRVGIGVATGCDQVFITADGNLVERECLMPIVRPRDLAKTAFAVGSHFLVNPWKPSGDLVDLNAYPRLLRYLKSHEGRLRERHTARSRPEQWYRTIDRIRPGLLERTKLLIPDLKVSSEPVIDEGTSYPSHGLYYIVSEEWDLEVLGGLLLSDVSNLFVSGYGIQMRGGTYRFQAQYLRKIRVPGPGSVRQALRRQLATAFILRDRESATAAAARVYGLELSSLKRALERAPWRNR